MQWQLRQDPAYHFPILVLKYLCNVRELLCPVHLSNTLPYPFVTALDFEKLCRLHLPFDRMKNLFVLNMQQAMLVVHYYRYLQQRDEDFSKTELFEYSMRPAVPTVADQKFREDN